MKSQLKNFLLRALPGPAQRLQLARQRRHVQKFERSLGLPDIRRKFIEAHGLRVLHGPFSGMNYVAEAVGSAFVPKLLGSYEAELHPVIEQIVGRAYAVIVDVGCAEGYYANGLALRLPATQVWAFDTDPRGRFLCQEMTRANRTQERVHVEGACDAKRLTELTSQSYPEHNSDMGSATCLVICDCEGCEFHLLDPKSVPSLETADILVELHEHIVPGGTARLLECFKTTHLCTLVTATTRAPAEYADLNVLDPAERPAAVSEFRPEGQQWAFLTSLSKKHHSRKKTPTSAD